jgi:2-methylcitrate dehydratase PrpD
MVRSTPTPTRTPPILATLGAWSARLTFADLPAATIAAARVQLLDMVAAAHASAASGASRPIERAARAIAAPGRATVLTTAEQLAPVDAAWINAAASMAHDYDDVVWMGHTCHSAVFAPLAVAEHEGASGEELMTAIVCANELGGRLGAACFLGPLNGQMWTFVHLISAAAGTAKLLGLDGERTTHALAIALAQPPFALQPGFLEPTSKLLSASTPIAVGIRAAYLAREGVTGAPDILEDRRGFFRRFSYRPLLEMLGDLDRFRVMETLAIKTYPGCHYFQTAFDAIAAILARRPGLAPAAIRRVTIETTKLATEATRFAREYVAPDALSAVNANFDLTLSAAIFLHAGRLGIAELEPAWLDANEAAIRALRERVVVVHSATLTARVIATALQIDGARRAMRALGIADLLALRRHYREDYVSELASPREIVRLIAAGFREVRAARRGGGDGVRMWFPNQVTIELTDGSSEQERIDLPRGSFAGGDIEAAIADKVMSALGATSGEAHARRALELGHGAERHDLATLAEAFRVRVG